MKSSAQTKRKTPELNQDDYLKLLGMRIKDLRIQAGHSSYEYFAYTHEISRTQYLRYEQGKDIRFSTLIKIISAFDISIEEFFKTGFTTDLLTKKPKESISQPNNSKKGETKKNKL